MAYSFARVSALTKMQVKDFYQQGSMSWFVLHEKGGKLNKVPAHHKAAGFVEQYINVAGIKDDRNSPLFRSLTHRGNTITDKAIDRKSVFHMIQRKIKKVGLPTEIGCHSFRGTGITNFLQHDGVLKRQPVLRVMRQPAQLSFMIGVMTSLKCECSTSCPIGSPIG